MVKGNKSFEKEYANCSLGNVSVRLGNYDDGDQYYFDIDMKLEGLYGEEDNPYITKSINISGRGIQELQILAQMFKDMSKFIEENT